MIIFLVACTEKTENTEQTDIQNDTITLRFGHDMPEDSAHHVAAVYFANLVKERSNGKIKIDIFPAEELGNDRKMIAMAQEGSLDIILPPTAKLSAIEPSMQILDLPYLFKGHQDAHRVLDGKTGKALIKRLEESGLKGFYFWESGFKQLTTNRPLLTLDDVKKLRIRVMPSSIIIDQGYVPAKCCFIQ